ncbi:MAG: F0F1 ATP synthase subunit alpha [Gammaproteobacteria bacterium]|jgi:F-type H+-transporting ATPase subunit alpha|nr:F0F1 ATP synthase subunit alpha [Gammaproteobacteria bacterium]
MTISTGEISQLLQKSIKEMKIEPTVKSVGTVTSLRDGIVQIHGMSDVVYGEKIAFSNGQFGLALNLEEDTVGAVVLGNYNQLKEGDTVSTTSEVLNVPTGEALLGRVVNALGQPIDGKGPIKTDTYSAIEKIAPGVIDRQSVSQPLQTGLKAIDAMTPIGRGQRELIIGDRQTGKTAIALDTIINQKNENVKCIYVAIGQKASSVANLISTLEAAGAMAYTTVVVASASDTAALQYIAPFAGCSIGEYFRDKGEDALIIYDDLSKHAVAYRQISLLLQRPPGREAFPGDIFYLHSRLLERASRVSSAYVERLTQGKVKGKTGSLTALPIIETQAGDVSAFVPTNVISITDGQIFLDESLFKSGIRPAINSGLSVSRVGGAAQTKIIKKLGGGTRLTLAQFRELEAFSQFASDLDATTQAQLKHGQYTTELLKQPQFKPLSIAHMALTLFMIDKKLIGDIAKEKLTKFEEKLHQYMQTQYQDLYNHINNNPVLDAPVEKQLTEMINKFKASMSL